MKIIYFCKYCKKDYEDPVYDGPLLLDCCRECANKYIAEREDNCG